MFTPSGPCAKCKSRPATEVWACCFMCANHGVYEYRCEACVLDEQIAYAERMAAALEALRAKLRALSPGPEHGSG